jgi:hypothetical protein
VESWATRLTAITGEYIGAWGSNNEKVRRLFRLLAIGSWCPLRQIG